MQEQGTKMFVDAVLKTHERVVQVRMFELPSASPEGGLPARPFDPVPLSSVGPAEQPGGRGVPRLPRRAAAESTGGR